MKYIKGLNIKNFRGIRNLELQDLGETNILVGKNNSGKTSVLEVIGMMGNPFEIGNILYLGAQREILNNQNFYYSILKSMLNPLSNSIDIAATIKGKPLDFNITGQQISLVTDVPHSLKIEAFDGELKTNYDGQLVTEDLMILQTDKTFMLSNNLNLLPVIHITPIDHLLENSANEVMKKGEKKELIQLLTIFDKDIIGLEIVEENQTTVPYIESKRLGLMPLSTYGNGLKRLFLLGSSIIRAEDGILLIDEVETAIHTSALEDVFNWFIKACKRYKVQVFMTTHSIEVIDAILEGYNPEGSKEFLEESLRVITLKNSIEENKTKVRNIVV